MGALRLVSDGHDFPRVVVLSGEEGDAGADGPPGDPYAPQHHRPRHPDQRHLRADQPADPRDQTAAGRRQAAEVGPPSRASSSERFTSSPPLVSHRSVCYFRSMYREILFLSLVALGRENIDIGECEIELVTTRQLRSSRV